MPLDYDYSNCETNNNYSNIDEIKHDHMERLKAGKNEWNKWAENFTKYLDQHSLKSSDYEINISMVKFIDSTGEGFSFEEYIFPVNINFEETEFIIYIKFYKSIFKNGVSFKKAKFHQDASFDGVKFYGNVNFSNVDFVEDVSFKGSDFSLKIDMYRYYRTLFEKVQFQGSANFNEVTFNQNAVFRSSEFSKDVYFSNSTFMEAVSFFRSKFSGYVDFNYSTFQEATTGNNDDLLNQIVFTKTIFSEGVSFVEAKIHRGLDFNESIIDEDISFRAAKIYSSLNMRGTIVKQSIYLSSASFEGEVDFDYVETNSIILDYCKFKKIPDFTKTEIKNPPSLSQVEIPVFFDKNINTVKQYRKLKTMAIDAHDHQKELEFFYHESRALRGVEMSGLKLWPSYLYEWSSKFGQSISRPFIAIILLWFFGGLITASLLKLNPVATGSSVTSIECPDFQKNNIALIKYSMMYSSNQTIPLLTPNAKEKQDVSYCLFQHNIPPVKHKLIATFQQVCGLGLLFLLGLGIRNRFRIK